MDNQNDNLVNILENVDNKELPKKSIDKKNIQVANFKMHKKLAQGIKVLLIFNIYLNFFYSFYVLKNKRNLMKLYHHNHRQI